MNKIILAIFGGFLFGAFLWVVINQTPPTTEIQIMQDEFCHYCKMVEMHRADPSQGWPDYKNAYDKYCPDECGVTF